eukprot:9711399-Heterocapsa_arctica.AAC.1
MRLTARPLQFCPRGHPKYYGQVDLRVQMLAHLTRAREVLGATSLRATARRGEPTNALQGSNS